MNKVTIFPSVTIKTKMNSLIGECEVLGLKHALEFEPEKVLRSFFREAQPENMDFRVTPVFADYRDGVYDIRTERTASASATGLMSGERMYSSVNGIIYILPTGKFCLFKEGTIEAEDGSRLKVSRTPDRKGWTMELSHRLDCIRNWN